MENDNFNRRIEILDTIDALEYYWLKHPELRLGQIVSNAAGPVDVFYVDDETIHWKCTSEDEDEMARPT